MRQQRSAVRNARSASESKPASRHANRASKRSAGRSAARRPRPRRLRSAGAPGARRVKARAAPGSTTLARAPPHATAPERRPSTTCPRPGAANPKGSRLLSGAGRVRRCGDCAAGSSGARSFVLATSVTRSRHASRHFSSVQLSKKLGPRGWPALARLLARRRRRRRAFARVRRGSTLLEVVADVAG